MPQEIDLCCFGMPGPLSDQLGFTATNLTATGSAQTNAALILSQLVTLTATGADGVILPTIATIGSPYWVFNSSASTGLVYCPVGSTMNGSTNGSLSVTTHKLAVFIQHSRNNWSSILSA